MTEAVTGQLTAVRGSLDRQLADIRTDTNTQLDRMRTTVDEKLQKTPERPHHAVLCAG